MPVKVIGADKVAAQFAKLGNISNAEFINVISQSTLSLLRNNTPVDTGELQNSWKEIFKTDKTLGIGVDQSQFAKLRSLVFGTKYIQANDFVTPVAQVILANIESVMLAHLKKSHPYFKNLRSGHIKTPSNIVALTGLKVNKIRQTGTRSIHDIGTGRKGFGRRLGLRTKRASFNP